ncbi:MAG: hypothetical protein EOO38_31910 [Cytophagaceae bacterium]|nr:MAG: hypothetical protein EOO38_31910 [Cytophagaceae bacterium]
MKEIVIVSLTHINIEDVSTFVVQPEKSTVQLHSEHSDAEHKRANGKFWRLGPAYKPGAWASKAHKEKENTSNMRIPWDAHLKHEEEQAAYEKVLKGI